MRTKHFVIVLAVVVSAVAIAIGAYWELGSIARASIAEEAAYQTRDFIGKHGAMPRDASDLERSWRSDYQLFVDPRSDRHSACVWLRLRGGDGKDWFEGHTEGWHLRPTPPR